MKIVAINGSPRSNGNTALALKTALSEMEKQGIETEILEVGNKIIRGCVSCGTCRKTKSGRCAINDYVNEAIDKLKDADGIIIGSPVYYAGINGTLKSFLDRLFYASAPSFKYKLGGAVIAQRRAGSLPAFEQINKYFAISEMITIGASYWNMAFGAAEGEAEKDEEGMQNMRVLGRNMAWLLKTVKESKVALPEAEAKIKTNFIR